MKRKTNTLAVFFIIAGTSLFYPATANAAQANATVVCSDGTNQQSFQIGWDNSNQFFADKGYIPRLFCEGGYAGSFRTYVSDDLSNQSLGFYNGVPPVPVQPVEPAPSPEPTPTPSPVPSVEPSPSPTAEPQPEPSPVPTVTPSPEPSPTNTPESSASPTPSPVPVTQPEPTPVPVEPIPEPPAPPSPEQIAAAQAAAQARIEAEIAAAKAAEEARIADEKAKAEEQARLEAEIKATLEEAASPNGDIPVLIVAEPEIVPAVIPDPEPLPVEPVPTPEPPQPEAPSEPEAPESPTEQPVVTPEVIHTPIVQPEPKPSQELPEVVVLTEDTKLDELPPETPILLENGVVLTAEVVVALQLLENPAELLAEMFTDPGQVLTALSNIGADMSPDVRDKSEKVVVSAIIAGGIATQAAASAAATAAYRRKP